MKGLLEVSVAILTTVLGQLLTKFFHLDEAKKHTKILQHVLEEQQRQTAVLEEILNKTGLKG